MAREDVVVKDEIAEVSGAERQAPDIAAPPERTYAVPALYTVPSLVAGHAALLLEMAVEVKAEDASDAIDQVAMMGYNINWKRVSEIWDRTQGEEDAT